MVLFVPLVVGSRAHMPIATGSECRGLRPGCYMAEFEVSHGVPSVEDGHHEPPLARRRRHRPSLPPSPVDLAQGADGWGHTPQVP